MGIVVGLTALGAFRGPEARAAGLLKPASGQGAPLTIRSHRVSVTINNGFAGTEVDQVFFNGGDQDLEAVYTFPLPRQASLSELSLWFDGQENVGEVLEKDRARTLYETQKSQGNDTGLAEKDDFKSFNIRVGTARARTETRVRFVYYQPLEIDLGVGRYVYPLAEGNVDEERDRFWSVDNHVQGPFAFNLELKSAFPVKDVRMPAYQDQAVIKKESDMGEGGSSGDITRVTLENREGSKLTRDVVFYYRLDDAVPARVELVPYRKDPKAPGTFMVVVTPAASLKRISEGIDWTFVLDVSGSMAGGKIAALANGVSQVLGKMSPNDRFRIVTFNTQAADFTGGYIQAGTENVQSWIQKVGQIQAGGSTALFEGLEMAYNKLDSERTTSMVLVTDGVCNVGPTRHEDFLKLMKQHDVRLFTFVIGNSANQPLMDRLARDSSGFAMNISESDDISGRLLQARAKVFHECLHGVELKLHGEKLKELTPAKLGSLYLGQQLVMFGRYDGHGEVEIELKGRISGQEQSWRCKAVLPEVDTDNPELERLWALSAIDDRMEVIREQGETESLRSKVVELGKDYSLVTDYTSMVVLRQDAMETEQIQRKNTDRVAAERMAQQSRSNGPVQSYRVDDAATNHESGSGSMFQGLKAPSIGSGPVGPLMAVLAAVLAGAKRRKSNGK
jgi:Ca-activated chloride channel family protein